MQTATADVVKVHRLLWEAHDKVTAKEGELARTKAGRIEGLVNAVLGGQPVDGGPDNEVNALEAQLEEARALVVALGVKHRAAVAAQIASELEVRHQARTEALAKKAEIEARMGALYAEMNRLQSEVNGLEASLRFPTVRSLRTSGLSGLAHELKEKLRSDPEATLLPAQLDEALLKAEKSVEARGLLAERRADGRQITAVPGLLSIRYDGESGLLNPHAFGGAVQVHSLLGKLPSGEITEFSPVSESHVAAGPSAMARPSVPPVPQPDPLKRPPESPKGEAWTSVTTKPPVGR